MSSQDQISVLIVDDEALARDTLRILLEEQPDFSIIGECSDGIKAVEAIRQDRPDLVFLDVQMPGLTGLEVVEAVGADAMPVVVFATAYDEYAVRAFETSAIDYLVKPFSDERFENTLKRIREGFQQKRYANIESNLRELVAEMATRNPANKSSTRFVVKEPGSIRFVESDDIEWVEAAGDYVVLHDGSKKHLIRETMGGMEKRLDPKQFVRIHRSTIVNVGRIREIKPYFHGDYVVYLKDGTELKLSRRYWGNVESVLGS